LGTEQSYPDSQQASEQSDEGKSAGENGKLFDENIESEHKLSKFAAAIEKAGLSKALSNGTEYTLFVPNDDAFAEYGADQSDESVEKLREVVRSHIVAGKVDAEQVKSLDSAMVLTGETVAISADEDKLKIGDAEIVSADLHSGNLTIHVIDGVLEPSGLTAQAAEIEEREEAE
jgi:uncharacterized surface protein with fasciclin (FAS1) repeats